MEGGPLGKRDYEEVSCTYRGAFWNGGTLTGVAASVGTETGKFLSTPDLTEIFACLPGRIRVD